jgi:transcriptional regulator with XRE-family HTH domain
VKFPQIFRPVPMARQTDPDWKYSKDDSLLQPWEHRAKRLDAVLAERNMSPRELSLKAGLSSAHVAHVLSGRIKSPRGEFWQHVANLTGTSVSYLLDGKLPMFADSGVSEEDKYPSRAGVMAAAQHLPASYARKVLADLTADGAHASDPGHQYWATQFALLVAKHSKE